jgi:hypothetical protein
MNFVDLFPLTSLLAVAVASGVATLLNGSLQPLVGDIIMRVAFSVVPVAINSRRRLSML